MAILHCVFCDFKDGVSFETKMDIFSQLEKVSGQIEGVTGFDYGKNLDFEKKSQDHGEGFIIRFADKAAADRYASDKDHQAIGAQLVASCNGGADGIMVYDIEC